jgi:hypothetical protein
MPGWDLPPPPENGMRVISPVVHGLEPGSNHEICAWTGIKVDQETQIRVATGYQKIAGHHVIVFSTKINMTPGLQRECNDSDMANWHQVVGTGGEGTASAAPGNLVFDIPAGEYITLQHHYINATDSTVDSQAVVDLEYADPGQHYIPSRGIAFLNTQLNLPPGPSSLAVHCVMQSDVKAWMSLPHMHDYGTMFNATVTHSGTVTKMVDNLVWDKDYTFHPPETMYDVNTPFVFHTGDQIDVNCNWNNTTSSNLFFGTEMCVLFGQTIDDVNLGNIDCDNGSWGQF